MSESLSSASNTAQALPPIDPGTYQFDQPTQAELNQGHSFQSILASLPTPPSKDHTGTDAPAAQLPPDLPHDDGQGGGTAGAIPHQGACAVVGGVLGGAGGAMIGGVGEGLAAAAAGTLIEPGGGTLAGAAYGVADGAKNGAFYGSATGAAYAAHLCGTPTAPAATPHILESRADPGLTQPTGPLNGTPTGDRSTSRQGDGAIKKAGVDSENQVADKTAAAGYETVQNPTKGPNPALTPERMAAEGLKPGKDPDLLIEGRVWDTYTPQVDKAGTVRRGIYAKIEAKQTQRVLVDLRQTTQTESSIRAAIQANPIPGLKEVMIVTDKGLGKPFRP